MTTDNNNDKNNNNDLIFIPFDTLSPDALTGLCETYIARYLNPDDSNASVADYLPSVMTSLKRGELVVIYSDELETAWLAPKEGLGGR